MCTVTPNAHDKSITMPSAILAKGSHDLLYFVLRLSFNEQIA